MLAREFGPAVRWCFVATLWTVMALAHDVGASVSIAVTWDGLLGTSVAAALVTPVESRSVWEDGRIVTYTRVHVDQKVAGTLPPSGDPWFRSLGGVVDHVGQRVEGEAFLPIGHQVLIFVGAGRAGTFFVTARGQGQFPVVITPNSRPRVVRPGGVGMLIEPAPATAGGRLAADVLHNRPVDDVARDIAADWERTHAR